MYVVVCRLLLDIVAGDAAEGITLVRAAPCNGFAVSIYFVHN